MTLSPLALTSDSYSQAIHAHLGRGREIARVLYKRWYRFGYAELMDDPSFQNCSALVNEIIALSDFRTPKISTFFEENGTIKALLRLSDGGEIEMVVVSMGRKRTLCLSSQLGCRQGCLFCQTGQMGFIRNLTVSEIMSQLYLARHELKSSFRNVVFMGMGEPFDNYDEVMRAISIMTDPLTFGIAKRHITLSTSGKVDGMKRFIDEGREVNLALSLNTALDSKRTFLMPGASRYDLKAIREVLEELTRMKRRVLITTILIDGITGSLEDASLLADYLSGLDVTINLIALNPVEKGRWQAPSLEMQLAFEKFLRDKGYRVFLRNTKGRKIMAACGQLGAGVDSFPK